MSEELNAVASVYVNLLVKFHNLVSGPEAKSSGEHQKRLQELIDLYEKEFPEDCKAARIFYGGHDLTIESKELAQ